ncbi:MAG: thioredoxin, partial [Pseudoflavonifractor sp.]
ARRVAISQQVMGLPVIALYENGAKLVHLVKDDATPEAVRAMVTANL